MALVDARQFQLSPNVGQAAQQGLAIGQQFRQGRQQQEESRLGMQQKRDEARINSVVQGAKQLKNIKDPKQKMAFLQNRKL